MIFSKRTVLIIVALLFLLVVVIAIVARSHSSTPPSSQGTPVQFPTDGTPAGTSGQTAGSLSILSYDKQPMVIKDFKKEPGVIADPNVPGQYDLVGGAYPDPGIPYAIFYQAQDDYFGITLLSEPLAKNRAAAEKQLQQMLGLSQADMCRLDYVLAPGPGINDTYAGKNLGFSFCPGAVQLPY